MVSQRISLKDVEISVAGKIIGGAESLTCKVERDNTEAYEGGNYMPVEIVGGAFSISGTLTRAFIDVELLNTIMPKTGIPPQNINITGQITSGKTPRRNITLRGVVFDSVDISDLALDGYAKNSLPFKALDWSFD